MKLFSGVLLSLLVIVIKPDFLSNKNGPQEEELIIGSWMIKDEPDNIWVFTATECYWIINSKVFEKFSYKITKETSPSGLDHTYVDLYPLGQTDKPVAFSYAINSLGQTKMTLEIIEPKHSLMHFVRLKTSEKE